MKKHTKLFLIMVAILLCLSIIAGCTPQIGEREEQGAQGERGERGEQGERGVDATSRKQYNVFATFGTLPTLYAGLIAFLDTEIETYMLYTRANTFDADKLKETNPHMKDVFSASRQIEFRAKIKELYDADNSAFFNLYCDDLRVQLEITLFLEQGIPEANYSVTLITDGVGSYGPLVFPYGDSDSYGSFLANKAIYDGHFISAANTGTSTLSKDLDAIQMSTNAIYVAQRHNVRLWMQFPELLTSEDPQINEQINLSNIEKVTPTMLFSRLSATRRSQFAIAANVTPEFYGPLFNQGAKKDLVITGTSLSGEGGNFENVLDRLVELYGDEYNLFFKAHPAWPPETPPLGLEGRAEFLESRGVTILPSMTPMEVLMWFYPHLYVGGYNSSLYMNVGKYQTLFFIAADAAALGFPMLDLYDIGYFKTASGGSPQFIPINFTP
jgi:hypothetical protein